MLKSLSFVNLFDFAPLSKISCIKKQNKQPPVYIQVCFILCYVLYTNSLLFLTYQTTLITVALSWILKIRGVVCWCLHNKIPQTGWLKLQKLIFSQFWRLEVEDQGVRRRHLRALSLPCVCLPSYSLFPWPFLWGLLPLVSVPLLRLSVLLACSPFVWPHFTLITFLKAGSPKTATLVRRTSAWILRGWNSVFASQQLVFFFPFLTFSFSKFSFLFFLFNSFKPLAFPFKSLVNLPISTKKKKKILLVLWLELCWIYESIWWSIYMLKIESSKKKKILSLPTQYSVSYNLITCTF